MSLELFLFILVIVLNIVLGLVVYLKNPRTTVNRLFALTVFWIVVWVASNFLENIGLGLKFSTTLLRLDFAAAPLVAYFWLIFCLNFPRARTPFPKKQSLLLFMPTLTFVVLSFSDLIIKNIRIANQTIYFDPGGLYIAYAFYIFAYMIVVSCGNLVIKYNRSKGINKAQLQYVFLGFLLSSSFAAIVNLIGPQIVPDLPASVSRLGIYGIFIFITLTTYAIVKHRLMDIRALVLKSVAYTIVLGIIAGGYAFAFYLVMQKYQGLVSPSVFDIVLIFLAIFGFNPLRRFIERFTDKIFAKGRYNFNELLGKLGKIVSSTVILDELAQNTLQTLIKDMRLTRAAFVETGSTAVKEVKAIGYNHYAKSTWEKAAKLVAKGKMVVADELEEDSKERSLLRKLHTEVLVPLTTENELVGILALGEKRSGDMFTAQDLRLLEIMAPETAIAVQNAETFKQREIRIRELDALSKLALSLGSTLELDQILNLLIEQVIAVTGAENGSIMLLDETGKTLSVKASRGLEEKASSKTRVKIGEGIAGWVAKTKEPIIIVNGTHENEYLEKCLERDDITSSLTVPLKVKERVIGVLSVNRKEKKEIFTEENLSLITSFAAHAAEAIENARLYDNLEDTFLGTITALAAAIDARDHYTAGHSEAVVDYATAIAKKLDFSDEEIKNIEIACRLHDIGKIGIDDAILNKPGRLTEEERKVIERHPKIAVDILKSVEMLEDVIPLILYHHERIDGKGYPTGLAGKAIPLGARIIAVVDSFNAMVSDRPYRKALPLDVAIDELKRCPGTQFDSDVVKIFLGILEREKKHQPKVQAKRKLVKSA